MPVHRGSDSKGPFYRYGPTGRKYYYSAGNAAARLAAKKKAIKQGVAIAYRTGRAYGK